MANKVSRRKLLSTAGAGAALAATINAAHPLDALWIGRAVSFSWVFTPLEVGVEQGFFENNRFKIETTAFKGDARLQQAMIANSVDVGIGSGPGMGFVAKGVPILTIARW